MGQRANLSLRRKGLSVQSTGRRCKSEVSSGWRERGGGGGAWLVYMYWWEITVKMCESQIIN